MKKKINIAIVGLGNIGLSLYKNLNINQNSIEKKTNVKIDINDALKYCKKIASKDDLIFIGGSLFLMSDYNEE